VEAAAKATEKFLEKYSDKPSEKSPGKLPEKSSSKDASSEKPAAADWGLTMRKPRMGARLKIAGLVSAIALTGGLGYLAYDKWLAKAPADSAGAADGNPDSPEVAQSEAKSPSDADDEANLDDPFDDEPKTSTAKSPKGTGKQPRLVEAAADAAPING